MSSEIIVPYPFIPFCQSVIRSGDFLIADTETTGFDRTSEVVELSIIEARSGKVVYDGFLKPIGSIPQDAMDVHHITEVMVRDSPSIKDEWPRICEAVSGRNLIFYNASFDKRLLEQSLLLHGAGPLPRWQFYCAMVGYAKFWKAPPKPGKTDPKWQSLEYATLQQGIKLPPGLHRALADCNATRSLLFQMAQAGQNCPTYATSQQRSASPVKK